MNRRLVRAYLGQALRASRERKKMSVIELATRVGVSRQTIDFYENTGPSKIQILLDICQALDINPSTIFRHAEKIQDRDA